MFFNKEKKQIEALIALLDRLEFKIEALQQKILSVQDLRTRATC
jgi:prefoldin subunit 5